MAEQKEKKKRATRAEVRAQTMRARNFYEAREARSKRIAELYHNEARDD